MKRVKRWAHEAVLDAMQNRLDTLSDAMGIRRQTVEHVFGTHKAWMGSTPFPTKAVKNVRTEMSLSVLANNIKRMIQIFGVQPLIHMIGPDQLTKLANSAPTNQRYSCSFLHSLGRHRL
ncbi:glycyl-tRNA synthetase beta subunit [Sphingobium boeckii]|uniref:Glycyl-tRNA synthetase beta subunit n=1 Tax=Sphingobium boeckii TaxID=1082345 RepID=A0A7W9AFS8_9SPHN|nr:glycyl-tRNA synthetase beta subunit [Sphingobium boeckii]